MSDLCFPVLTPIAAVGGDEDQIGARGGRSRLRQTLAGNHTSSPTIVASLLVTLTARAGRSRAPVAAGARAVGIGAVSAGPPGMQGPR